VSRDRYFVKEGDFLAIDKKKGGTKQMHYMLFNGMSTPLVVAAALC
jgi:hypothetical protein